MSTNHLHFLLSSWIQNLKIIILPRNLWSFVKESFQVVRDAYKNVSRQLLINAAKIILIIISAAGLGLIAYIFNFLYSAVIVESLFYTIPILAIAGLCYQAAVALQGMLPKHPVSAIHTLLLSSIDFIGYRLPLLYTVATLPLSYPTSLRCFLCIALIVGPIFFTMALIIISFLDAGVALKNIFLSVKRAFFILYYTLPLCSILMFIQTLLVCLLIKGSVYFWPNELYQPTDIFFGLTLLSIPLTIFSVALFIIPTGLFIFFMAPWVVVYRKINFLQSLYIPIRL